MRWLRFVGWIAMKVGPFWQEKKVPGLENVNQAFSKTSFVLFQISKSVEEEIGSALQKNSLGSGLQNCDS